jgi:phosphoribosylglycinamide formyltransferase 1
LIDRPTSDANDPTAGVPNSQPPLSLGVLLSGTGRTLLNIHESIIDGRLDARIACVISSRPDVLGVDRARNLGLSVIVVPRATTPDPDFHDQIADILRDRAVDLVCLAGFTTLWRIPPEFDRRVLNIHPALLPKFGGKGFFGRRVHEAVIDAHETTSGCTVHVCDNQYDHGPIVLQREVPVYESDTPDTLADRVFDQERIAYPEAIRLFTACA